MAAISALVSKVFARRENLAVGAQEAGEAGVEVAAIEEGADGRGGLGGEAGHFGGVIVENLPDRRGAGLVRRRRAGGGGSGRTPFGGMVTLGVTPPRPRARCTKIMG
jgi:hypothetical protein